MVICSNVSVAGTQKFHILGVFYKESLKQVPKETGRRKVVASLFVTVKSWKRKCPLTGECCWHIQAAE